MKRKTKVILAAAVCLLTLVVTILPTFAAAYSTYTYSIDGNQLLSPDAYTPQKVYNSAETGIIDATGFALGEPTDLAVDVDGNVYICDVTGRKFNPETGELDDVPESEKVHRIVVLDRYFKFRYQITEFVNEMGALDKLNDPKGLCLTEDRIYIADGKNKRIVILNREDNGRSEPSFYRIIGEPSSDVFPENYIYSPIAVASDGTNIYVVSATSTYGIISLNMQGEFQGFIGAQKVSVNLWDIFWRNLQNAEQRANSVKYVSTEYNNITIDRKGFIYVTTSSIDEKKQQEAITKRDKSASYAPVKKLNTNGDDIMNRTGFYPPSGEVKVATRAFDKNVPSGASTIIDVAIGPAETWSIIDQKRQRIFTYDKNGNLLFAFGDRGEQLGNIMSIESIDYQDDNMVILDKENDTITVYSRTEYGDLLIEALEHDNERKYELAVGDYQKILQRNINFDTAYIGIAKALYRSGDYEGSMEQYSYAYNTEGYSQAFKMYRKDLISRIILVVPLVIAVVVTLIVLLFKVAKKVNTKTAVTTGKRTFISEILFAFHLIFHPFDGYWDLKHEKRGSLRGAFFYFALTVLVFTYQSVGRSYMYNPRGVYSSIGAQLLAVGVPIVLWVVANWCLTTLFDGEGSVKDIFIATCYSLTPLVLLLPWSTILTHILASTESGIINLITSIAWVWVGLLIFFGVMVTHDYSIMKNVGTCLGTIIGMGFIMFLCILFATLVSDMIGLVTNIVKEITYRM